MSRTEQETRESLRDRFLELSLEEVLGVDGPGEAIAVDEPRRPARWIVVLAAACLLIALLPLLWRSADETVPASLGERCEGVVLTPEGQPVAGASVQLELGWSDEDPLELRYWLSAARRNATTDEAGRFRFDDLPAGATGIVLAHHEKRFARGPARSEMKLVLAPGGTLSGWIQSEEAHRQKLRIYYSTKGWNGVWPQFAHPDEKGLFRFEDLPPGPGVLFISHGNWPLRKIPLTIEPGVEVEVEPVKLEDLTPLGFSPDPLLDVTRVRLVDENDRAMQGVSFTWSSPWGAGASRSNEEGLVILHGGGVMIGKPPFYLQLGQIGAGAGFGPAEGQAYRGRVREVVDDTAVVVLTPLTRYEGTVRRNGTALAEYALLFETGGKPPWRYYAALKDGRYSMWLPSGSGRFLALTPDGKLHRIDIEVSSADGTVEHDIELSD